MPEEPTMANTSQSVQRDLFVSGEALHATCISMREEKHSLVEGKAKWKDFYLMAFF